MTLRVPVDNGKYAIEQDDSGRLSVSRGGEPRWLDMPPGSKMLVSAAYELAVLRRLVSRALRMAESAQGNEALEEHWAEFGELVREMEGYMDFQPGLSDPGEI